MGNYSIIRYYIDGKRRVVRKHVTLEEAQEHCRDEKTRKEGEWFDGYTNA